jgi:hypothetical protein
MSPLVVARNHFSIRTSISAPFSTPESNLSVHLYHQFFHQLATSLEWRSCSVAAVGPGVGSQRQEKGDLSNFMSTNVIEVVNKP